MDAFLHQNQQTSRVKGNIPFICFRFFRVLSNASIEINVNPFYGGVFFLLFNDFVAYVVFNVNINP